MSYLNSHRILASNDLDEVHQAISSTTETRFDISGANGNFDATFAVAAFGDLSLFHVGFGDVEMDFATPEEGMDALEVLMLTSGTCEVNYGNSEIDLSPKRAFIRDLAKPVRGRDKNFSTLGLNLPRAKLRRQACALVGPEARALDLNFDDSLDLTTAGGQVFLNTVMYVNSVLDGPLPMHENPLIAKQLEDLVLTQALALLPNSCRDLISGATCSGAVPFYVKRARDHIHAHVGEPITLSDLATAAGCGYRTLQAAFNEAYGMPPMSYLRKLRLQKVHADVLSGDKAVPISEIARKWGFTHLGRFARSYAREFGELPSETLRRGA